MDGGQVYFFATTALKFLNPQEELENEKKSSGCSGRRHTLHTCRGFRFRKHGQIFNAAHASWQINTVWLTLLLAILAVVAVIAIGAWMGNDPFLEARLDAIINSDLAPIDGLRAIWNIPGVSTLVTTIIIFAILCLIWPLKRVLHGMMALRYGLEPAQLGARRWLALALAVTLQVLPMLVFVLL